MRNENMRANDASVMSERTSEAIFFCCPDQNLSTRLLLLLRRIGVYFTWNEWVLKFGSTKIKKDFAPAGARCQRCEVLLRRQPGRRERDRRSQWWQVSYSQQSWCVCLRIDVAIWVRFASREAVKKEEWLWDWLFSSMRSFALHSYGVGEHFHFGGRFLTYMSLERSWILRMRLAALACSQQDHDRVTPINRASRNSSNGVFLPSFRFCIFYST